MTAVKKGIFNKTFSLLRGIISGKLKIYRTEPARDICVSLELEFQYQ